MLMQTHYLVIGRIGSSLGSPSVPATRLHFQICRAISAAKDVFKIGLVEIPLPAHRSLQVASRKYKKVLVVWERPRLSIYNLFTDS